MKFIGYLSTQTQRMTNIIEGKIHDKEGTWYTDW